MDNLDFNLRPYSPQPKKGWRELIRKPWFILMVTAVVICGVIGLSINQIMLTLLHSRPEVVVPNLEGESLLESLSVVSSLGLSLKQDRSEFDDGLPAGTILMQHPPAGMQVRQGRAISVVVSKGGQGVFVPNVVGRRLPEAQSHIQSEKLQLGAVTQMFSVDVNEGLVIAQNPSSGTVVTRGSLVDLDVSKGLPPAGAPLMPDFVSQSLDKAQEWAKGVSVEVKVVEDPKIMGVAGTVIKQSPKAGQPLLEGDSIRLTVVPLAAQSGDRYEFQVPADRDKVTVRIVARDSRGESEIYKNSHKGGDKIALPLAVTSATRIRVYVDDVLQEENVLEP